MQPLMIIDLVALSPHLLGRFTPHLTRFASKGQARPMQTSTPALTCTAQASLLTGLRPKDHGIVGNGWFFREVAEIAFWRQSNRLVNGEKIWDAGKRRDVGFTCANLCWWYNMAATHDIGLTPRPIYKADGRKLPDCYTKPAGLRDLLTLELGAFPLFQFWGPGTHIASSRWIAAAAKRVLLRFDPTLTLVYLPHLDYDLQRFGPDPAHPSVQKSLQDIDAVAGDLIRQAQEHGRRVLVLSEYGITAVDRAIHINRHLRAAGYLAVRNEDGAELLDPIASQAFAVADHQIAHVYVAQAEAIETVGQFLLAIPGVESVTAGKARGDLDHERSGDLVVISNKHSWFSYYYWFDDARAPDFASTVDIHRKPGYDPAELFIAPHLRWPNSAIAWRLLKRKLGLRGLMDVIGLDAGLVKGSHGRSVDDPDQGPLIIGDQPGMLDLDRPFDACDVKQLSLETIFGERF